MHRQSFSLKRAKVIVIAVAAVLLFVSLNSAHAQVNALMMRKRGAGLTPAPFSFWVLNNAARNGLFITDIIQISGISGNVPISVAGTGSPSYRVCSNTSCGIVLTDWTTGAGTIQNSQYIQVRLTSAGVSATARTATVTIGAGSANFTVTTASGTGVAVGGSNWVLAGTSQSCTSACSGYGSYQASTLSYAGSSGTNIQCQGVLDGLGVGSGAPFATDCTGWGNGSGCRVDYSGWRQRCTAPATNAGDSDAENMRACACS